MPVPADTPAKVICWVPSEYFWLTSLTSGEPPIICQLCRPAFAAPSMLDEQVVAGAQLRGLGSVVLTGVDAHRYVPG